MSAASCGRARNGRCPTAELEKQVGYSKDIEKSRAEARRLLKEAGVENLKIKLFNRTVAEPYTPSRHLRHRRMAQDRRCDRAPAGRDQDLLRQPRVGQLRRGDLAADGARRRSDGAALLFHQPQGLDDELRAARRHQARRLLREAEPHARCQSSASGWCRRPIATF